MTTVLLPAALEITHLDEGWAVPCERASQANAWDHCEGANPAEWALWVACGCSPVARLYCTGCKDIVLGYQRMACASCLANFEPASTAYLLIEPLNGRST